MFSRNVKGQQLDNALGWKKANVISFLVTIQWMTLNSKNNMLRAYVIQYFPNILITDTIKVVYIEGVTEFGISELGTFGTDGYFSPF